MFEEARTCVLAFGGYLRRAAAAAPAARVLSFARAVIDVRSSVPSVGAAAGAPRSDPLDDVCLSAHTLDQLTPQEFQIALILAGGKTTREAAAALFLSPKTIEYHLRHVYRKLRYTLVRARSLAEAMER